MNSISVKAKFPIGQFKSLKQIFCKFRGQFDPEGQGQVQFYFRRSPDQKKTIMKKKSSHLSATCGFCVTMLFISFRQFDIKIYDISMNIKYTCH